MHSTRNRFSKVALAIILGATIFSTNISTVLSSDNIVLAAEKGSTTLSAVTDKQTKTVTYKSVLAATRKNYLDSLAETSGKTDFFKTDYEWTLFSLARDINATSIPAVYQNYIVSNTAGLQESAGLLFTKYDDGTIRYEQVTEYDKLILTLTALNVDVTDIDGLNLFDSIPTFTKVKNQGLNGVIFTLLSLNARSNYAPSKTADYTKQDLVDYLIDSQKENGGWTLWGEGPDADITAMTLQALAPYKNDPKVNPVIEKGLTLLSQIQSESGGFYMGGSSKQVDNSNSAAQVITALSSLGVDPTSSDFTKNGISVIENLLSFYLPDSGFKYLATDTAQNGMATVQAYYSLTAYDRYLNNLASLYSMDDAKSTIAGPEDKPDVSDPSIKDPIEIPDESLVPAVPTQPEEVKPTNPKTETKPKSPNKTGTALTNTSHITPLNIGKTSSLADSTIQTTKPRTTTPVKNKKTTSLKNNWVYNPTKFKKHSAKKQSTKLAATTNKHHPLILAIGVIGLVAVGITTGFYFGFLKGKLH